MEDTLRYFFSAIFQGIAAILTLGAMFYMNYNEKIKSRINELEKEAKRLWDPHDIMLLKKILLSNIIYVMRDEFLPNKIHPDYDYHRKIVQEYETIIEKQNKIKKIMPFIVFEGVALLIFSSISLFCVGYSETLDQTLFIMGIVILLITLTFLANLESIMVISTGIEPLKIFKWFKNKMSDKSKDKTIDS